MDLLEVASTIKPLGAAFNSASIAPGLRYLAPR
jgi:hypothetical protein